MGCGIPSDAIRIQEVTPLEFPWALSRRPSCFAWVRVDARLVNDSKGWQVTELRTGKNDWAKLDAIISAVNEAKRAEAQGELALIAKALESFRRDRGSYVVSDQQAVVIDHLNPRYLARIIRVDPWQQPNNTGPIATASPALRLVRWQRKHRRDILVSHYPRFPLGLRKKALDWTTSEVLASNCGFNVRSGIEAAYCKQALAPTVRIRTLQWRSIQLR